MSLDMNVQPLLNDLYLKPYFNTRTALIFRALSLSLSLVAGEALLPNSAAMVQYFYALIPSWD